MIKRLIGKAKPAKAVDKNRDFQVISRADHCVSRADIDPNALKVLRRLAKSGYEAYLVGGGVRDLLMRHVPKDFDVVTNAKPDQIRRLFRNCRLIGRRFLLAHVVFGREIIEVATFRAAEDNRHNQRSRNQSGMILHDNVYGTMASDVWRRDFTINALYYNIKDFSIIDYTGGVADIRHRIIRLIGDPWQRYQEDPVRILRAIRFAAKLDFTLEAGTEAPIAELSDTLKQVASARLFEEVIKLFHHGHGVASYQLLLRYELFHKLFSVVRHVPTETLAVHQKFIVSTLKMTDERIAQEKPVTPAFIIAAILWHPLQAQIKILAQKTGTLTAFEEANGLILREAVKVLSIPRRITQIVREIWLLQYRLPKRYGKRAFNVLAHPRFRAAYNFLKLRAEIGEESVELVNWWDAFQVADEDTRDEMIANLPSIKHLH